MRMKIWQWFCRFFERIRMHRYTIVCMMVCLSLSPLMVCLPHSPLLETQAEEKEQTTVPLVAMHCFLHKPKTAPMNSILADAVIKTDPDNQTVTFLEAAKLSTAMEQDVAFKKLLASSRFGEAAIYFINSYKSIFKAFPDLHGDCTDCSIRLVIFGPPGNCPRLAYQADIQVNLMSAWQVLIDARTEEILKRIPLIIPIKVY